MASPPKELATLATYKVNIRSFHPEKDFGWSGFYFHGDNRGFSLKPSGLGRNAEVTSRVWHRFSFNTERGAFVSAETHSNPSGHGDNNEYYKKPDFKPRHAIVPPRRSGTREMPDFQLQVSFGGENYLMPFAKEMEETFNFTYVPTLNVRVRILMTIDRVKKHMDLVTFITGDGFPNCEAFIVDPSGQAVFLGIHVRKGVAPVMLAANLDYPMITSAIRLTIDSIGNFTGHLGDELLRRKLGQRWATYQFIGDWNARLLASSPNRSRSLWTEEFPLNFGDFK